MGDGLIARLQHTRSWAWVVRLATALLGAYAAGMLIYNPLTPSLFGGRSESVSLADFGSFYASGQAAGQGLDPYDVYPLTLDAARGRGGGAAVNLNAPTSLPIFQLLTIFDPYSARRGWFVATLLADALLVGLLMWAYPGFRGAPQVAWALAMTPLVETLIEGQVYAFLALVAAMAHLSLRSNRSTIAGCLMGFVAAIKPNFVAWPILLWIAGERRAAIAATLSGAAFAAIPVLLYGPQVYARWLAAIREDAVNSQVANASIAGVLVRNGLPQSVGIAATAVVLLLTAAWMWRRRPGPVTASGVAVIGLLLASPLAWIGYSLFILPSFARMRGTVGLLIAGAALCIPRLVLQGWSDASPLLQLTIGSAYTLAWLIVLAHEVLGLHGSTTNSD